MKNMNQDLHFRCPCCHGSQYRTSSFDVTASNPHGAKCIFCKSAMVPFDNVFTFIQSGYAPMDYRK